jgi:PAS domain S-box-containing protein
MSGKSHKETNENLFNEQKTHCDQSTSTGSFIPEQKKMEEALIEGEERFRLLFEDATLSYQSLDEFGNFIEVNETWCQTLGYTKDEVIGRNFSEFILPELMHHFKINFPKFKKVGYILGVEFEMIKKDRSQIIVTFNGIINYKPDGSFKQTHCIFRDITEQKKVEAELILKEKAFEASIVAISFADEQGIITDANNTFLGIWGYTSKDEVIGKPISHFLQSENDPINIFLALNKNNEWCGEFTALRKDTSTFNAFALATSIKDEFGNIVGYQSAVQDITERKKSEKALQLTNEILRTERETLAEKNKALGELLHQIEIEKKNMASQIQANVDRIVLPLLGKLEGRITADGNNYIKLLARSLNEITSPYINRLETSFKALSPREIEICNLIKAGMSTKEIAISLNTAVGTVSNQRKTIRKKLKLTDRKINLTTSLKSV